MSRSPKRALSGVLLLALTSVAASSSAAADDDARPVDRASLLDAAVRAHPAVRAAEHRAAATRREGDAQGRLPPPVVMAEVWRVPFSKPYAVGDAGMIMLGVGQTFPAIGARGARERAAEHLADAETAMGAEAMRRVRADVDHAFAEYVEATEHRRAHVAHLEVARRTLDLARARHAGGGSLEDFTHAELEVARMHADLVTDGTRIESARARINALLGRDPLAPLGPPTIEPPTLPAWDARVLVGKARERRPELRAAEAVRAARREEADATDREAKIPSFTVAALYFAPTTPAPVHGFGVNAQMTLPWLWGGASARRDGRAEATEAARYDVSAVERAVTAEVVAQEANARAQAARLRVLSEQALPASKRAFEVSWAGYETARTSALTLLAARLRVVDTETQIIKARAGLDHALASLEAAVGGPVPRRPIGAEVGDEH